MNTIKKGTYKTVLSWYGNHKDEIFIVFLSKGWCPKSETKIQRAEYYTFEAGEDAQNITLDLANARIL